MSSLHEWHLLIRMLDFAPLNWPWGAGCEGGGGGVISVIKGFGVWTAVVVGHTGRGLFTDECPSDLGRGWSILQRNKHIPKLYFKTNFGHILNQFNISYITIVCLNILNNIPVDFHANRLRSGRRIRGLHDLLNKLMCHFPLRQENICLVSSHTLLQASQVKHGHVTALWGRGKDIFVLTFTEGPEKKNRFEQTKHYKLPDNRNV